MKIPDLNKPTDGRQVFKTPDGYFENLSQRMMQGVSEAVGPVERKNTVPFWKSEIYAKLKPYIYMAAMFGGLYFGVWVYKYQQRLAGEKEMTEGIFMPFTVRTCRCPGCKQDAANQQHKSFYNISYHRYQTVLFRFCQTRNDVVACAKRGKET